MRFELTTLLFEIINFVVLMAILRKLLYQPLRRAIEARRAEIESEQQAAKKAREQAEALLQEQQKQHAELRTLQDETRRKALEEAVSERARILARAREDAVAERAQAHRLLESERRSAQEWVQSTAIERSTELAGRMLRMLAPEVVDKALLEHLVRAIEQVKPGELSAQAQREVEVIGSELPAEAELERLQAAVRKALGAEPELTVRRDPNLLGGFVVRVGDQVYDASIAGELDALRGIARGLIEQGEARE